MGAPCPPLRSVSKTVLTAVFLLPADILLPQQDAYASAEYGFPLLAAVGAAGCIGYLLGAIFRLYRAPFSSRGLLFGSSSAATSVDGGGEENLCVTGRNRYNTPVEEDGSLKIRPFNEDHGP